MIGKGAGLIIGKAIGLTGLERLAIGATAGISCHCVGGVIFISPGDHRAFGIGD